MVVFGFLLGFGKGLYISFSDGRGGGGFLGMIFILKVFKGGIFFGIDFVW